MRKTLTLLFALLCVSLMGWAETEKFVPGNASISKTDFFTTAWASETNSSAEYNTSTEELTVNIVDEKNADWQGQVFLQTNVSFDASKDYDISFKMTTSKGIGNIIVKMGDANYLYEDRITTGAGVEYTYNHTDVKGKAGNDGNLIFDFGHSPANTNITISNISIVEKEAAQTVLTSECSGSRGHEGGAPHFDFEISYDNGTTTLTATPKNNEVQFDFFQINVNGTITDLMGGESTKASVTYTSTIAENTDLFIAFLYSPTDFGGNYQTTAGFVANGNDPNIVYYKVGDCSASGAVNPQLTLTNPTKSSVLLPKGESITVAYTSDNEAAASIESSATAVASVSGNAVTAEATGTATITVRQAEVTDTWQEASVAFEVNAFDWADVSYITGYDYKFKASSSNVNLVNIQGRSGHNCIYVTLPDAVGLACSLTGNYEIVGAGLFIYTDAFTTRQTPFTISWNGNVYDCYVYYNLDETAPVISGVQVTSHNYEQAIISITADEAFVSAEVFNNGVSMGSFTPSAGAITVTGLTAATKYDKLTVKVTDAAGNVSVAANVPEFTTSDAPTISPATYYGYSTQKGVYALYSITRNPDMSVTFSAKVDAAFSFNKRLHYYKVGVEDEWVDLVYNSGTETYDYTVDAGLFIDGEEWVAEFYFPFTGDAASIVCNYTVGSEQAAPAPIPAGAVVLNRTSNSLSVGETDVLAATVYPSFATNKTITWSSDDTDVASVDNGTVTAVAEGTALITATCGEVSAQYTATVTASLEEAKYYGTGAFTNFADSKDAFAYEYCFTRATNHEVTLDVVFSEDMTPYIGADNFRLYVGDQNNKMDYDAATKTATYHFGSQSEGAAISCYFYFIMAGGAHQSDQVSYTVGSPNEKMYACVVDEDINNSAVLAAYDGRTAQVIIDRSFTADNLYTLVLPFNADAAQTAAKLPGKLTKLNNTIVKENEDLRLNFVDAVSIEAGVPYLYTPSEDVVNPVFTGVTIRSALRPTAPTGEKAAYYGIYAPTTGAELKTHDAYVLGSDQYLYAASVLQNDQPMKALRGYFVLSFLSGANAPRARVIFNSQETEIATGISDVQSTPIQCTKVIRDGQLLIIRDGRTYDAQGQLIK